PPPLGRQVICDPGGAPAPDAARQSARDAGGPPTSGTDAPTRAAGAGESGGESLLSGRTGPRRAGTGRGRRVPHGARYRAGRADRTYGPLTDRRQTPAPGRSGHWERGGRAAVAGGDGSVCGGLPWGPAVPAGRGVSLRDLY